MCADRHIGARERDQPGHHGIHGYGACCTRGEDLGGGEDEDEVGDDGRALDSLPGLVETHDHRRPCTRTDPKGTPAARESECGAE